MAKNLKIYEDKAQSNFMLNGIPALTVCNAVDWMKHAGTDKFFKEAPCMQSESLQNSTRKIERLISEQLVDFKKDKKPHSYVPLPQQREKKFGENLAILVTPAQNKYGMMIEVCNREIAEARYEKAIKQQGKKIPFTGVNLNKQVLAA